MIKKLVNIPASDLMLLGALPILLYALGFFLTGAQVFRPTEQPGVEKKATVVQNVQSDNIKNPVELEKNKEKDAEQKKRVLEARSRALKSVAEIQGNHQVITDIPKKQEETDDHEPEVVQARKPITTKKRNVPIQQAESPVEQVVDRSPQQPANQDPYANFEWKEDVQENSLGYTTDKKYYEATFLKSRTLNLKEDHIVQIINTENIILRSGETIPENTVMTGFVSSGSDRFFITVKTIETRKMNLSVNLAIYDNSYAEGIQYKNIEDMSKEINKEIDDIMNGAARSLSVNTPVGSISLPSRTRKGSTEVYISKTTTFKIAEK